MRLDRVLTLARASVLGTPHSSAGRTPVLMYHSVSNTVETGVRPYYRINVTPARFHEQMQWLLDHGYTSVSLEDLVSGADTNSRQPKVAITFDDGYVDFLDAAWPVLNSCGFQASVFLPTAFISNTRQQFNLRSCLTEGEVRDLHASGTWFGSHTVSHPILSKLSWPEIEKEAIESKHFLEALLGCSVNTFAYPFAYPEHDHAFTRRLSNVLSSAGYVACATTAIGTFKRHSDPLRIPRLPVNNFDDRELFVAKLRGAYDWLRVFQRMSKHRRTLLRFDRQCPEEGAGEQCDN